MITGLRLKNFRSFLDTGRISFRPITLLIGKNSSGKSSFLRAIPLLKQSIRTDSNAPVLWFGEYVDFGSINDVRFGLENKEDVSFEIFFNLTDEYRHPRRRGAISNFPFRYPSNPLDLKNTSIQIDLNGDDRETNLRGFTVRVGRDQLSIDLNKNNRIKNCIINGKDYSSFFTTEKIDVRIVGKELVPQIIQYRKDESIDGRYYAGMLLFTARQELLQLFKENLHQKTSRKTIIRILTALEFSTPAIFRQKIEKVPVQNISWQKFREKIINDDELFEQLRNLYFVQSLPNILGQIQNTISGGFFDASYIGPARATGERYYRHQELAVDQIDPKGQNMAMFLSSMPQMQFKKFAQWLEESIGYSIKIVRTDGHLKIELKNSSSNDWHNIADMGYGFSQVLPVMTQIWSNQFGRVGARNASFFAVEQPELHLHPAYQGALADIFCTAVQLNSGSDHRQTTNFVIETHSEALINRLGDLISQGKFDNKDVAIFVFDKSDENDSTQVRKVEYNKDGTLLNWPLGFFSSLSV